jgi:predicted ATP-grasp superfamily ATP-dependent carboligase
LLQGGLNLVRPLGLASIPVVAASSDPHNWVFASKYVKGRVLLPGDETAEAQTIDTLLEAGARLAGAAGSRLPVFYGKDETLHLLARHRDVLSRYYTFLLNDPALNQAMLHKDAFEALATSKGVPVPRTLPSGSSSDLEALAAVDRPIIVKPRQKIDWHETTIFSELFDGQAKGRVFENGRALLACAAYRQCHASLIVQQYIPGDDANIYSFHGFAAEDSEVLAYFCGRKIRTYPAVVGESCFIELARDEELATLGTKVIKALGFKGPFKIDLKKSSSDGRFYVLEINARFNLWHYLGAMSGVNLPAVAYDYLTTGARPAAPGAYATNYRWLDFSQDRRAFAELRHRGELSLAAWLRSIVCSRNVYQLFSWRDPRPFFHASSRFLLRRAFAS